MTDFTEAHSFFPQSHRLLEDEAIPPNDSEVLRNTFMVYGSILICIFLLFCFVRQKFPRPYKLRSWVEDLKSPLAETDSQGYFSWIWRQRMVMEDELMDECGLDALCFLRVLKMGLRISLLGVCNAIWLMPLYDGADTSDETDYITDSIIEVTIAHVPSGSKRLIATTIAAYFVFGYTMYLIYKEFDWFIEQRQKFLKRPVARNYAIYVQGIPPEYRTNASLANFFRQCYSEDSILGATVRVNTPNLSKVVAKRDSVQANLEHAIAYEEINGVAPTHRKSVVVGGKVNSIEAYTKELRELNRDVQDRIDVIATKHKGSGSSDVKSLGGLKNSSSGGSSLTHPEGEAYSLTAANTEEDIHVFGEKGGGPTRKSSRNPLAFGASAVRASAAVATATAAAAASTAAALLEVEDGEFYEAGFLTLAKLSVVHAALQMKHGRPFEMETFPAPDPEDIIWTSLGKKHKELQLGKLASFATTVTICLLWTIPMAFFASLSSVEGLKEQFSWVEDAIDAAPFLEPLLKQLAPLFVVVFNSLLPIILEAVTMLEFPISGSIVEASMFVKLAAFMIIQTFFVSAISGSVTKEISNIISDPASIIDLLANTLPAQSTFFIQIVFVSVTIMVGLEILRVVPLVLAWLRTCIGPRLTETERSTTFMGIRPLCDPQEFEIADTFSQTVLFFVVLLVYSVIAPIVNFVMAFCFVYMGIAYRHQFIYIYPARPDSGGKLWTSFIGVLLVCLFIAEFTIAGLLALKKAGIASILMFPLIIITILFNAYIRQQHFRVTENLTSRECLKTDLQNSSLDFDLSFVKDAYVQPELQDVLLPSENPSDDDGAVALDFEEHEYPLAGSSPSVVANDDSLIDF